MNAQCIDVYRVPMGGPGDMSGIKALLDNRQIDAQDIVAILGKTEGNGGVNDFTREFASQGFSQTIAPYLGCSAEDAGTRIAMVMSGGTEGVLSPHATIFTRRRVETTGDGSKRLAIGVAHTREFLPEELGCKAQIDETARAVSAAMEDAGITDAADVHFVQIKCPLLTAERVEQALERGRSTVTDDAYGSMAYSRGASSLGVAMALRELAGPVDEKAVLTDLNLYSAVASASAGIELTHSVIVVMGNSKHAVGDNVIGHALMQDAIDLRGVMAAFSSVGLDDMTNQDSLKNRVVNVFAKAESSPNGRIRGFRHTMLDDSDITPTRHARAAVGGLISGVVGNGAIYVSGGAEHQGPPGGGPIAVIVRCS
jgi:cyanuric acid amidohydrolase